MKKFSILLVLILLTTFVSPGFVQAKELGDHDGVQVIQVEPSTHVVGMMRALGYEPSQYKAYIGNVDESLIINSVEDDWETQAVPTILIFLAGIVVGYIIDGVVIAITGKSTGEWVSDALIWVANGLADIVKMIASQSKIERAYNNVGCVQYRPRGPWVCPY